LLIGVLVNLTTSFLQYAPNLTLPAMQDSLSLSYTQAGMLVTGAWMLRVPCSFLAGILTTRYGSRRLIGLSTLSAGASMLLIGGATHFWMALGAMCLMGAATGMAIIPTMGMLGPWFDSRTRGLAAGLASAGGSSAFVVAGLVVPGLTAQYANLGWRYAWALFGAATVIIGTVALGYVRDRPSEMSVPPSCPLAPVQGMRWPVEVCRNRLVWLMSFMVFCSGWSQGIFNTFLGTYLSEENGIDLAVVGRLLILIGVLSIGSGIVWGRISDWIGRSLAFLFVFLVQSVGLVLVWLNPMPGAFVIAAILIGLTHRATFTICAASAGDFVPLHLSSAAFALMSTGAGSGAMISPSIAGGLADATGSLQGAFAVALGGSLCGALGSALLYGVMRRKAR
jgi:MFS family permease